MYIVLLIVPFCPSAEFKTRCFVFRTGPGGGTSGDNKIEAAAEEDKDAKKITESQLLIGRLLFIFQLGMNFNQHGNLAARLGGSC